jgi:hypothetical protein
VVGWLGNGLEETAAGGWTVVSMKDGGNVIYPST